CRSNFRNAGRGKSTPDRGAWRSWSRFFAPGRSGRRGRSFRFTSRQAGVMPHLIDIHRRDLDRSETEVPGDDHALHFVRALADLQDLLIPVQPGDRRLLDEAVAAVDLERLVHDPV